MSLKFVFLDVGNADSILVLPDEAPAIIIDIPKPTIVRQWLNNEEVAEIDCIYFTHAHADHLPSLPRLVSFVEAWLRNGVVKTICVPTEAIRQAFKVCREAEIQGKRDRRYRRIRDALDFLIQWDRQGKVTLKRVERDPNPQRYGALDVYVLHPSYLFYEAHHTKYSRKLNETSLVLRVEYGEFSALMLADVEGSGIQELLSGSDEQLRAELVKIPHHGAWPKNSSELRRLLEKIDAEVAVLSVGSKNPYGHVVPDLFRTLLELQAAPSQRLKSFLCTEVTRTCIFSASERARMRKAGLASQQPCAGDIVITVDDAGQWVFGGKGIHQQRIQDLSRPACLGRAEL